MPMSLCSPKPSAAAVSSSVKAMWPHPPQAALRVPRGPPMLVPLLRLLSLR